MTSIARLKDQLQALGVPQKGHVVAHVSLRAVGETEGRGEGFLEALISYVTKDRSPDGGLLCIPTHTWASLGDPDPVKLDMNSDQTCVGTLPTLALRRPDCHRSMHPTHSMAVFGDPEAAEEYIAGEVMTDTSTGPKGCWGKLYYRGGSVLLVGVGHERDTFLHAAEEILGVPNRLSVNYVRADIRLRSGDVIERPIRCHHTEGFGGLSDRFPKLEPAFRAHGCIRDGVLGEAKTQLCDCRKMTETLALILERSGGRELFADETPIPEEYYR
ncbi:MAG: AAC(3) family N-acetyltransferase [Clostridia bacterium]|nr:AAC(3) family N-acetyltransferase [Clostridia bacterium]